MVDNLVFVEKQDGRATEQVLPVEVSLQVLTAEGIMSILSQRFMSVYNLNPCIAIATIVIE